MPPPLMVSGSAPTVTAPPVPSISNALVPDWMEPLVVAPSAELFVIRNTPLVRMVSPPYVFVPLRTIEPAPVLVMPRLLLPSPMLPPTVKVLAVVVRVMLLPKVTAPVPRSRSLLPVKVKSPFQFWTLFGVRAIAPLGTLMVVPAPMVNTPLPRAVVLLMFKLPLERVNAPDPEFVPERVTTPVLVLLTEKLKAVSPLIVSEPVGSTSHVWAAPMVSGAEIVALPPLASTRIPPEVLRGVSVSAPPVPAVIVTSVMPEGTLENWRLSITNAASRVVVMVLVTVGAPAALKITVSAEPGMLAASNEPPGLVVQFAVALPSVFQDKFCPPRQ